MARLAGLLVLLLLCTNVLGLERKSSLRLGRSTMSHSVKDQVRLAVQQAIASTVKDCDSEDCDIPGEVVYTEGSSGGIDEGLQGVADTIAKIDEWIKNFREVCLVCRAILLIEVFRKLEWTLRIPQKGPR